MSLSEPFSGINPPPNLFKWSTITLLSNKKSPSGFCNTGIFPRGFLPLNKVSFSLPASTSSNSS